MKLHHKAVLASLVSAVLVITTMGCAQAAPVTITGSGSTFVKNYIEACAPGFTAATGNSVSYAGGGSGKGRTDITNKTVDFAASDTPFATGTEPSGILQIPLIAGPIAIQYRIDGVKEEVHLRKATLAKIFAGQIKAWNDPAIVADNTQTVKTPVYKTQKVTKTVKGKKVTQTVVVKDAKGKPVVTSYKTSQISIKLPSTPIRVYYRSDSSGTSGVFTAYLNSIAPTVWSKPGNNSFSSAFPTALPSDGSFQGASGSDGVSNGVQSTNGAISYAEVSYATERKLGIASLENEKGNYVTPSAASAAAFLSSFTPGDKGTIVPNYRNPDPSAYNLTAFAYGLAYSNSRDKDKDAAVKAFFTYLLTTCSTNGSVDLEKLGYAPLVGTALIRSQTSVGLIG